ncbi:MAG: NrdH-redoxin [Omnitrophica WOR_2 bacterium GWF2_43_52]|nr:MAG: NrdH-redoxin [Omnitrophica WOR_2 bacterium GWC2_44_8]OGX20801.1 MAG: NrdH-redoxin [Omnitrophica WOR_2 bacterium GWF2_43_52]HAH19831.1 NrdH-redoxin [Candidatus Omnitrophota bacterium]HBG63455.1 NrdH-redoxin [Candidatus Omnitrophota bacterium]HCD38790.1 NrdH-redoxin [Candidatus Omnitrophota bacterium]
MHIVTVYSTPNCPYCVRLKAHLSQQGIAFTNLDVSVDKVSLDKMIEISGQMGVPVIDIDGQIVVGFEKEKIDNLLAS